MLLFKNHDASHSLQSSMADAHNAAWGGLIVISEQINNTDSNQSFLNYGFPYITIIITHFTFNLRI